MRSPLTHSSPGPRWILAPRPLPWAQLWVDAKSNNRRMSVPKSRGWGSQGSSTGLWHWSTGSERERVNCISSPNMKWLQPPKDQVPLPQPPPPHIQRKETPSRNVVLSASMHVWSRQTLDNTIFNSQFSVQSDLDSRAGSHTALVSMLLKLPTAQFPCL